MNEWMTTEKRSSTCSRKKSAPPDKILARPMLKHVVNLHLCAAVRACVSCTWRWYRSPCSSSRQSSSASVMSSSSRSSAARRRCCVRSPSYTGRRQTARSDCRGQRHLRVDIRYVTVCWRLRSAKRAVFSTPWPEIDFRVSSTFSFPSPPFLSPLLFSSQKEDG